MMMHTSDFKGPSGFEAVNSEALLSSILSSLTSNLSKDGNYDLTEIYSEYTTELQGLVQDHASVRVYDKIKLLREELDVIKDTLLQQKDVMQDFKTIVSGNTQSASLSVTVIDGILEKIEQRIDDFDELQVQAENARHLATQSISLKAENNSKAILVFTVTTVTFLPMSFVTSYLGMNTSDLRNMDSGQTLFWAIGAPLAFIVLSAALVAAFYDTHRQRVFRMIGQGKDKLD